MKKQSAYRIVGIVYLLVFILFNTGIPIVKYLCPLMDIDNPVCSMMPKTDGDAPSISYTMPDCCRSYTIAEHNTNPYLPIEKNKALTVEVAHHFDATFSIPLYSHYSHHFKGKYATSPPGEGIPVFVLNSAFLI